MESPPKENPCTLPTRRQRGRKKSRGTKLLVRLLVAGGIGEVKAHESDEGVDVLDGHGLHVAELRSRGGDRGDVVKSRSHRVILQSEARLEATSEELVRDRCTCDGVQEENFCLGPQMRAPPKAAAPVESSVSVISSSASRRRRAMVSKPARVVTKARAAARSRCPSGRERGGCREGPNDQVAAYMAGGQPLSGTGEEPGSHWP